MKKYFFVIMFFISGCLEAPKTSGTVDLGSTSPLPINHPAPDDKVTAKTVEDPSILGTRFYVRSVFEEIFQVDASKAALAVLLDKYLGDDRGVAGSTNFENISTFGGPCDVYSAAGAGAGCSNSRSNIFNPVYASPTPSRESVRVKLCTEVTNNDGYITVGLDKVGLTTASDYNSENFGKVFEQFYPGLPPSTDVTASFLNLWNVMTAASESPLNKWRMIYFTVCRTPEWQIL